MSLSNLIYLYSEADKIIDGKEEVKDDKCDILLEVLSFLHNFGAILVQPEKNQ